MYRIFYFIFILIIFNQCDNPQISEIPGCLDKGACNFSLNANLDDGSCQYPLEYYDCDNNCLVGLDCEGVCGGSLVVDECGVCGGNGPVINYDCDNNCLVDLDCSGVCGGSLVVDECGVCGGDGPIENYNCSGLCIVLVDCSGVCGGSLIEDDCGVCGGEKFDNNNDGIVDSNYDCNENCIVELDCLGICGGTATVDACNICAGDILNVYNCPCPSQIFDECGVCNGPGAIYECGCTEIEQGRCDCSGKRSDCAGVCGGSNFIDACGNCGDWIAANNCHDNCRDCSGKCGGDAVVDCSGECSGSLTLDCAGVCGGSATVDNCGVCGDGSENLEYELVWSDEFSTNNLNLQQWNVEQWSSGTFNQEKQAYTDNRENIFLKNDALHIRAIRETYDPDGDGLIDALYTSGRISTKYKGDWQYVKVEVKAQLPQGKGTWPAIWMLPTYNYYGDWPASGEIDIMEYVGSNSNRIHSSIHNSTNFMELPDNQTSYLNIENADDWHIYSMIWKEDEIIFYVDDQPILTYNDQGSGFELWPFDQKFHLVLNLAIGGSWGGEVDPGIFPVEFIVDYVRVYKQECY
jgi:beta-glucanase (GH16 family)